MVGGVCQLHVHNIRHAGGGGKGEISVGRAIVVTIIITSLMRTYVRIQSLSFHAGRCVAGFVVSRTPHKKRGNEVNIIHGWLPGKGNVTGNPIT